MAADGVSLRRNGGRAATDPAPHNLPASVNGFLGRDRELDELGALLDRTRLVTLTGTPGVGKSRLALELAKDLTDGFPGGVWLAELAVLADGALVAGRVADALSVAETPGRGPADAIAARIAERRVLLVLDNCEHLIIACAELVDLLLRRCPALRVLATSREPLHIAGETVWQVATLSTPRASEELELDALLGYASVRLFLERARAVQPEFRVNAHTAHAVGEICRRLDGIPLALELAAARVEVLAAEEIARRLDVRFGLLTGGPRSDLPRHRTLEAALDWSHDLLGERERVLLRRVSVFTGGFCLEAAETVCSDDAVPAGEVFATLARLVSRSLVLAETSNGSPRARYRLLETIRAYTADKLERAGESETLREAHARFYLALSERAEPELTGPAQEDWIERLETDHANLRAAIESSLAHGQADRALRLTGALVLFWRVRCHFTEGRDRLAAALEASDGERSQARTKALWGRGFLTFMAGDLDGGDSLLEESLELAQERNDLRTQARALLILGNIAQYRDHDEALALLRESAALAREAGDSWCLAHAVGVAGFEHCCRDELAAARVLLEECLTVARAAQDSQSLRMGLLGLGLVAAREGNYDSAEPLLEEALLVTDGLGEDYGRATALRYLGELALGRGRHARAAQRIDSALALLRVTGPASQLIPVLVARARIARAQGDRGLARERLDEAAALARSADRDSIPALTCMGKLAADGGDLGAARHLFERALELARARNERARTAETLLLLGGLGRVSGDLKRAAALYAEALELFRQTRDAQAIMVSLDELGGLSAAAGRCTHAARLFGASETLRQARGYARLPWEQARFDADLRVVRDSLSGQEFESAFTQGAGLSIEEAVVQACKGRGRRNRPSSGWSSLTDVEQQISALVAEGLTNARIAERLLIAPATVKNHVSAIFSKLGVGRRAELAAEVWRRRQMDSDSAHSSAVMK